MTEATTNRQLGGEVGAEQGASAEYIDPWCDQCYDDTGYIIQAYGFCPECNTFICKSCHGFHRKWPILQNHKIFLGSKMPKSQAEKPVKYPVCTTHAGNIQDHYCIDHSEMICSECIQPTHQSCAATPLSVICKDLGSADIQQFETIVDTLKQNVLSTKSSLESNITDIENQKEDLIKLAKEERDTLISRAGELYENTVSMINDACEQKNTYITEQVMTLDNIIQSLDETNTDISKKENIKFDQNVFIRMQQIVEQVREYKSEIENMNKEVKRITLSFSTSSDVSTFLSVSKYLGDVEEISSQLGDLQSLPETVFPQASHESAVSRKSEISQKHCDIPKVRVNKLSSLDTRLLEDKETCSAGGIAVTSKGDALVSDSINKSVKAFSQEKKLLSCLTFSEWPYGISVINDDTSAVTASDNKLNILNISDIANISIERSVSLEYWACGITQYKDNLIVTKFDEPQCVKMIDLNGAEKWSVSADHEGQQLFDKPYSVTINTSDDTSTIIVSDWSKDTLTLLDPNDGHFIKTIDANGKQPHGLTSDKDGNVYVCFKCTKEICVFSPDFEKSQIRLSSGDLNGDPTSVVFCCDSGVLFTAYDDNDTVDCFQLA